MRKEVALKVLDAQLAGELASRFEREALATARLDHPGCVRVLDYGRTLDGLQFIAMELCDGPTTGGNFQQYSIGVFDMWMPRCSPGPPH